MQKLSSKILGVSLVNLALLGGLFAAETKTLTGTVGDAMCGAKHMGGGSAKDCTLGCVAHGSKYALVVGDKVYTLTGKTEGLKQYAGDQATVTGTVNGDTIEVASVSAPTK